MVCEEIVLDRDSDVTNLAMERLEGELEAALVFAAAAHEQYQAGELDFGCTLLSDAADGYANVIAGLTNPGLTVEQRRRLNSKINHLRAKLEQLGIDDPATAATAAAVLT